jgi:hypothetical protein
MSALDIIWSHRQEFQRGLQVTLQLCLIIWSIGILTGVVIGVAGARWKTAIGLP